MSAKVPVLNSESPKVAVLVPAFKEQFFKNTLESLLAQTYDNFIIIVVDDASPYNLNAIVNEFKDTKLSYFRNPKNIGGENLAKNWNNIISSYSADADLIVMASDDDLYHPDFISSLVRLSMKYPDIDLFHCRVGVIDDNDHPVYWGPSIAEFESDIDFIYQRAINRRTQLIPDFMFRKNAIIRIGGFTEYPKAWYSDEMTVYRLAKDKGVVCAQETLFFWRSSNINISSSTKDISCKIQASKEHLINMKSFIKTLSCNNIKDKFLLNQLRNNYPTGILQQLTYDLIKSSPVNAVRAMRNIHEFRKLKWFSKYIWGTMRRILHF